MSCPHQGTESMAFFKAAMKHRPAHVIMHNIRQLQNLLVIEGEGAVCVINNDSSEIGTGIKAVQIRSDTQYLYWHVKVPS